MTKRIQDLKVSMASSLANDSYFLNKSLGMAVAFELGLARVCSLKLSPKNGSLDTHGSHEGAHLTALSSAFERLESLFSLFKNIPFGTTGSSLFDQTTFVLTSEFSRTPALNASLGKDHNPQTNSVLFAGAGIKGLQKAGASRLVTRQEAQSTPYMVGVPYDFELKKALASPEGASSYIRPENCIVTLEKIFGVPKSWSVLQSKGFREVSAILA